MRNQEQPEQIRAHKGQRKHFRPNLIYPIARKNTKIGKALEIVTSPMDMISDKLPILA
jgi:hypothetical protein